MGSPRGQKSEDRRVVEAATRGMAASRRLGRPEDDLAVKIFASVLRRYRHLRPVRRAARITARSR